MEPDADPDISLSTERLDTRLTIPRWPADADDELREAVWGVTTFEDDNPEPVVLGRGADGTLVWRGYLTGGMLTLHEFLAPLLAEHGLAAIFADPRVEVHVDDDGPVVVLDESGEPLELSHEDWCESLRRADAGANLAELLDCEARGRDGSAVLGARLARGMAPDRATTVAQPAPGQVDWSRLADADAVLVERYEPEGLLEGSTLTCQTLNWKTEFLAPGTELEPEEPIHRTLMWRVAQYEWADPSATGVRWRLRARTDLPAHDIARRLPAPLAEWVRRATTDGIELCRTLLAEEGETAFGVALRRLQAELDQLAVPTVEAR